MKFPEMLLLSILLFCLNTEKTQATSCILSSQCSGYLKYCCGDYECASSCKGKRCSSRSDCASGEVCCSGYCKTGSSCTCLSNSVCGYGRSCCNGVCKAGYSSCTGYSCTFNSDCQWDEYCCSGSCSSFSCGTTSGIAAGVIAAIIISVLIVIGLPIACVVAGICCAIGPCRRRPQVVYNPGPSTTVAVASSNVVQSGAAYPTPQQYPPPAQYPPPGQGPPPYYPGQGMANPLAATTQSSATTVAFK